MQCVYQDSRWRVARARKGKEIAKNKMHDEKVGLLVGLSWAWPRFYLFII